MNFHKIKSIIAIILVMLFATGLFSVQAANNQQVGALAEKNTILQLPADDEQNNDAISAMSTLRMAMVKLEAGEFEKALEIGKGLTENDKISSLAWYVMGVAHSKIGEEEEAIRALEISLRNDALNKGAQQLLEVLRPHSAHAQGTAVHVDTTERSGVGHVGL